MAGTKGTPPRQGLPTTADGRERLQCRIMASDFSMTEDSTEANEEGLDFAEAGSSQETVTSFARLAVHSTVSVKEGEWQLWLRFPGHPNWD